MAQALSAGELAIIAQDPRFGGGSRSFASEFWSAAVELGKTPRLLYLSRARGLSPRMSAPRFAPREENQPPFFGDAIPSFLPELDALNMLVGGERIARRVRRAPFVFVVAASAPYGWGAYRSRRPYGCWIATSLRDEWDVRRPRLDLPHRVALAAAARPLTWMERTVLRRAAVVATISERSRQSLATAAGLPAETVDVWPVPVDLDEFAPLDDAAWALRLAEPTVVFVGRARDPRKNVGLLVDAFELVAERVPSAKLRLVGEPPPAQLLRGRAATIEVTGEVDAVPPHLRDGALFVLPSLQEGFGIVVAEAFACGVPAVVTPSGGPEDLVRRSGAGVVLHGWSPRELADAIVELLSDRNRLHELRGAARAYVEREHSRERLTALVGRALVSVSARSVVSVGR